MQLENEDPGMFNFTELDKEKLKELTHGQVMESECKTWGVLKNKDNYVLKLADTPKQLMIFESYGNLERFLIG